MVRTNFCADFFWISAIFDRNFANIVAPPSDENANYVVHLKEQSLPKKTLKTASKSGNKRQRKACSNYAPLECTVIRTWSVTNKRGSSADADKPARRVWRSVKVTKHSTIPSARYSFLLCNSNFVFKTTIFDFKKCHDLEMGSKVTEGH